MTTIVNFMSNCTPESILALLFWSLGWYENAIFFQEQDQKSLKKCQFLKFCTIYLASFDTSFWFVYAKNLHNKWIDWFFNAKYWLMSW